ncbi:MAG: hypothetical protein IJM46_03835 [Oscillospiraceae bacterium]|nr:hypothetical protein [Oscillospiraceae bacterium]
MMKTCDEMIRDVHIRIAEYEAQQKRKKVRLFMTAAAVVPVIALGVIGAGLLYRGRFSQMHGMTTGSTAAEIEIVTQETVSQSEAESAETSLSELNPNNDSSAINPDDHFSESADRLGDAVIDGWYYLQISSGAGEYSPDRYLGKGSDFEGYYADLDISAEFYTAKESEDVVVVLLGNGGQVNLQRIRQDEPNYSDILESEWHGPDQAITTETGTYTEKTTSVKAENNEPADGCDVFKRAGDPPTEFIKLIRSYPATAQYCYSAPPDGSCALTIPLSMAMEEYGNSANYLLELHLFSGNGTNRLMDEASLTEEAKRLYQNGLTSAIEKIQTQEGTVTILSLNVTYDQIKNFPTENDHSYFLLLYDEAN